MEAQLYEGVLEHVRCSPVVHRFVYPFFTCGFPLRELDTLAKKIGVFSYNRFNLLSIHDADYLGHLEGSLEQKVREILRQEPELPAISDIELVTHPRLFGYIFNPVSFFRCYCAQSELRAVIVQVNNTFKESHLYLLSSPEKRTKYLQFSKCKVFHVSPFNDMSGIYRFYFRESKDLDIRINLEKSEEIVFTSKLAGKAREFTLASSLAMLLRYPGSLLMTSFRISWQAAKLYFGKKLPVYTKPIARDALTIQKAPPGPLQSLCLNLGKKFLSRIHTGYIRIECADGTHLEFGDAASPLRATLYVHNYDFFVRSLLWGDIGFGESYVDGQWDCDDLAALLRIFLLNERALDDRSILLTYFGRAVNRIKYLLRPNSISGSRKNISAHYDMSNELFRTFLDPSMTYSCAYFKSKEDSLEQAQHEKISRIIDQAQLRKEDHLLEIGCGWGSFAITAAREVGCRVTAVTLSKEQHHYALEKVREAGLESRIDVRLCDYRTLDEKFDKIVSIEMLEAVGHSFLGQFFSQCDRLLKPNGLLVLQVITFPDYRYQAYRYGCDWVQKYIFPGGLCPSLNALSNAATKNSNFVVERIENIGVHYAETLARWRERFITHFDTLAGKGFDTRFFRMWTYYLTYCEAGFSTRTLGTHQLVLTRTNNASLGSFRAPEWREDDHRA